MTGKRISSNMGVMKTLIALILFCSCLLAGPPDVFEGGWKARSSKIEPASVHYPVPSLIQCELIDNGYRLSLDTPTGRGRFQHTVLDAILDGKPHPIPGRADTAMSAKRDSDHAIGIEFNTGSRQGMRMSLETAGDGKTLTLTIDTMDHDGNPIRAVSIFERN